MTILRRYLAGICVVAVGLGMTGTAQAQPRKRAWTVQDFQRAGAMICGWQPNQDQQAIDAVTNFGLTIVDRAPRPLSFVVCEGMEKLTEEKLAALRRIPSLRFVEPDFPALIPSQVPSQKTVDDDLLKAFEDAGAMICAWEPGKDAEAEAALKDPQLGLRIVDRAAKPLSFFVCEWDKPLTKATLERLVSLPMVRYVQPDETPKVEVGPIAGTARQQDLPKLNNGVCHPKDEKFGLLWGMVTIKATKAWCCVQASDTIVAVIDSGVQFDHPDLEANMWRNPREVPNNGKDDDGNEAIDDVNGADFVNKVASPDGKRFLATGKPDDGHGHGTHVAGTIGAVGNNTIGVAGVNWRVPLMAVKVLGRGGRGTSRTAEGIVYAVDNGAKVMNISLCFLQETDALDMAIQYAKSKGVLLVCAAGNNDNSPLLDNDKDPIYPASFSKKHENVIAVLAIDRSDTVPSFSHYGKTSVNIGAPGVEIWSTHPPDDYKTSDGTSMASPHVAGAAALYWGRAKSLSAVQVKDKLFASGRPVSSLSDKCSTGKVLDLAFLCPDGQTKPPDLVKVPPQPPSKPQPEQQPQLIYPRAIYQYSPIIYYPQRVNTCPMFRHRIYRRCR